MILKYITYNKLNKTWDDTKCYLSICNNKIDIYSGTFIKNLYDILFSKKMITIPYEQLGVTDCSGSTGKIFNLIHISNNPRSYTTFARLHQLPIAAFAANRLVSTPKKKPYSPFTDFITYTNIQPLDFIIEPLTVAARPRIRTTVAPVAPVIQPPARL